jgi:hypothetical protein
MNNILLLLVFFFSGLLVISCVKDIKKENPETCKVSTKDSSFRIEQIIGPDEDKRYFESDTIPSSRIINYFTAVDSTADEYLWQFSGDPRIFTGRQVKLAFIYVRTVEVTLTIKRNPSNKCFQKLGAETVYRKNLVVLNADEGPILGKFYGYNASDTTKKFVVEILLNGVKHIPFTTTGDYYFQREVQYTPTAIFIGGIGTFDPPFGAYATEGFGYLKNNNTAIQIDYSYRIPATGFTRIKDTFYGIKQF